MMLVHYCKEFSESKDSKNGRRMLNFKDKRDYEKASLLIFTSMDSQ